MTAHADNSTSQLDALRQTLRSKGLHRGDYRLLSSGMSSDYYLDSKAGLSNGADLRVAALEMLDLLVGLDFDAVGGMSMGADHLSHSMALLYPCEWFAIRPSPKDHGLGRLIEGADVSGKRVVVVDEMVTTGRSVRLAIEALRAAGASVVGVVVLVDRGESWRPDVPYHVLFDSSIMTGDGF